MADLKGGVGIQAGRADFKSGSRRLGDLSFRNQGLVQEFVKKACAAVRVVRVIILRDEMAFLRLDSVMVKTAGRPLECVGVVSPMIRARRQSPHQQGHGQGADTNKSKFPDIPSEH
jgi:hypothetical protein